MRVVLASANPDSKSSVERGKALISAADAFVLAYEHFHVTVPSPGQYRSHLWLRRVHRGPQAHRRGQWGKVHCSSHPDCNRRRALASTGEPDPG